MSAKRNSYKGKWLALKEKLSVGASDDTTINVETITATVEKSRVNLAKLEAVGVTLLSALSDSTETLNDFLQVREISFRPLDKPDVNGSVEDIVRSAVGLIYTLTDRFGLCATALEEHTGVYTDPQQLADLAIAAGNISKRSKALLSKKKPDTTNQPDPSNLAGVGIRGKIVKFEAMSPIAENEVPSYALSFPEGVQGTTTEPAQDQVATTSEPVHGGDVPNAPPTPTQARSRSRSPSQSRARKLAKRVMPRPSRRTPTPTQESSSSRSRDIPYRETLPTIEDINWVRLRKQLNHTDQLYTRGLSNRELYEVMVEERAARPINGHTRGKSLSRQLRRLVRSHDD
jgi:hypothetical protein